MLLEDEWIPYHVLDNCFYPTETSSPSEYTDSTMCEALFSWPDTHSLPSPPPWRRLNDVPSLRGVCSKGRGHRNWVEGSQWLKKADDPPPRTPISRLWESALSPEPSRAHFQIKDRINDSGREQMFRLWLLSLKERKTFSSVDVDKVELFHSFIWEKLKAVLKCYPWFAVAPAALLRSSHDQPTATH